MKLHLTQAAGSKLITAYGPGWVEVNDERYSYNLIVLPHLLVADWLAGDFTRLTEAHLHAIVELAPEVVLLGTGVKHRFLPPPLACVLTERGIGLECMNTAAACRTYNIIVAEGRHVAAALIL